MQAGPRTSAPPAITQSLVAASRATTESQDYDSMKAESLVWSLALVAMCSVATAYFYSQVRQCASCCPHRRVPA